MDQLLEKTARGRKPAPETESAARRAWGIPHRLLRYVSLLALLAVLSTVAGFQAARLNVVFEKWLGATPVRAALSFVPPAALVSSPKTAAKNTELEEISHLSPQQQAERLLDQIGRAHV